MGRWCRTCRCLVRAPCSSHHFTADTRRGVCKRFRSTKGASKARRDHINGEIRSMRSLLPISQDDQDRLSYLHSMAIICTYIRKSVLLQGLPVGRQPDCVLPYEAFLDALHGFILVTTATGRLVYVSENVSEYLGLSMVDVLQNDSFYEMVEQADVSTVKSHLETDTSSSPERSFVCCMHSSKAFRLQHGSCCSMLVRGSFQTVPQASLSASPSSPAEEKLFVGLCTPTANRLQTADSVHLSQSFTSVHEADMTYTQLSDSVLYYLGFSAEELTGRSWYSLVHPEDLSSCSSTHKSLIQADEGYQVEMVVRLQCKDMTWTWVYTRASMMESDCLGITCTNHIISETEATFLTRRIHSDAFKPSHPTQCCPSASLALPQTQGSGPSRVFKRRRTSSNQSEESSSKSRMLSEPSDYYPMYAAPQDGGSPLAAGPSPAVFTPPYSPASSYSPPLKDDSSSDFLFGSFTEQLCQSSPESSPSYYSCAEAGPGSNLSTSEPLPVTAEPLSNRSAYSITRSPESAPSPSYEFPSCVADARLVPDCLSVLDLCETSADCPLHPEVFAFQELPQESRSLLVTHVAQSAVPHSVPSLHPGFLTPNPSPISLDSFHYSEREQAEISILARQISSLASSFDMYRYHGLSFVQTSAQVMGASLPSACDWPPPSALPIGPPMKPDTLPAVLALKAELLLDDGVFDSILKDLDVVPSKDRTLVCHGTVPCGYQQGVVPGLGATLPLGHDASLGVSLSVLVDRPSAEQAYISSADTTRNTSFAGRSGCHKQNTELHQLNDSMCSTLHKDGLVEESLY